MSSRPRSADGVVAIVALVAAIVVVAASLAGGGVASREPAPRVSYTLLDGRVQSLESLRGKVILVNFWATTCSVCVAEMPQIAATHQRFAPRGYATLAVAMRHDPPARVVHFTATHRLPFGVAIDNLGEIARDFGDVAETPTSFLIDKRGRVVARYVGAPDFAALAAQIERLLGEA